jgi:uncharacterized membrane protein YcaP (DUF421 family)
VNASALRRHTITRTELGSIARDRGFSRLAEVALIVLERNGRIAVMGEEAAARRRGELSAVGLTDLEADATTA